MQPLKISLLGACALLLSQCVPTKSGISYFHQPEARSRPSYVLILDSGNVQEYPRTSFDKHFGTNTRFSEALLAAFKKAKPESSSVELVTEKADIAGLRYALRRYFGVEDNVKPGTKPLELPKKWTNRQGPFWIITDWEYQVSTNVEFGGVHQAPGGASLGIHEYGYHRITVFGVAVNQNGEVARYASASTKRKYIQGVKHLPLDKVMRRTIRKLGNLLDGGPALEEKRTWPTNLYRR